MSPHLRRVSALVAAVIAFGIPLATASAASGASTAAIAESATVLPLTPANTSAKSGPGYSLESAFLLGDAPAGMKVYVNKATAHHATLYALVKKAANSIRKTGLSVTFVGYYTKASAATGVIDVTESAAGCAAGPDHSLGGITTPALFFTSSRAITTTAGPGYRYVDHSLVRICPRSLSSGKLGQAVVGHELGHAVGLGHTQYKVDGAYQLMNPVATAGRVNYGSGDIAGFKRLAAGTLQVKATSSPISGGKVMFSSTTPVINNVPQLASATVTVRGAAKMVWYPGTSVPVAIAVKTSSGVWQTVATTDTNGEGKFSASFAGVLKADYRVTAISPINGSISTVLAQGTP